MAKVVIYEHGNYTGKSQEFDPGRYTGDAIVLADNTVTSVAVPAGWKVTLWSDRGFAGSSTVLSASSTSLVNQGFNDALSSLTVTAPRDASLREESGSLGFLNVSGSPTYVSVGSLALDFGSSTRGFTFEAWVWFDSTGLYARVFDFHRAGQNGVDNILLARSGTGADLVLAVRKGGTDYSMRATGVIENGQWMHLAVTIDPTGKGRIYSKGTLVAEATLVVPNNITRDESWLGRSGYTGDAYFAGQLAEVRVWNVTRTAEEIQRTQSCRLTGREAGLVRYYRMDDAWSSSGSLVDLAGIANGTVTGQALYSLAGPKLADAADAPGGLWFDGVSDYVTLPAVTADLSNGFTLEAWVNFESTGAYSRILEFCNSWTVDSIILARDNATNNLGLTITRAGSEGFVRATGVIQNGTWMHVAATMDSVSAGSGRATLYINGQVSASATIIAPSPGSRAIAFLGKSSAAWDPLFKGRMADVRIWSRARTQEQIQAALLQRLDPKEPGLVAYYPLDERGETVVHDVSPSGLDGVAQSGIGWKQPLHSDFMPLVPPRTALLFNGSDTYVQLPPISADFSSGMTLEAWVCFDSVANWARIFDLGNGGGQDCIVVARANVSQDLNFSINQDSVYYGFNALGVITTGRWMHVAATLDAPGSDGKSTATIYVNGVAKASGSLKPPAKVTRRQCLVGKSGYADPLFKGRMAELRIWTRARSQAELREAMNRTLIGNEPGLHLYYPLAETSGSQVNPQLVAGSSGGPPWPIPTTQVFNGVDTAIRIPSPSAEVTTPALSSDFSAGFTIEAWVNCDAASSWARIVELGNGPGSDNIVVYRDGITDTLLLSIFRGSTSETLSAAGVLVPGSWRHIAVTLDAPASDGKGTATLYLNGVPALSGRMSMPRNVVRSQCYIGKSTWTGDALFQGRMTEVRIWNRARTQAELQSTMNRPLQGSEAGLCVYRALSEEPVATIQGKVLRQLADAPSTTAGAMAFDGSDDAVQLPAISQDLAAGFALQAWVYLDDLDGASACIVDLGTSSGSDRIALSRDGSAGDLLLSIVSASGTPAVLRAPAALKAGQWLHVAATLGSISAGSGQAALYVNGVSRASGVMAAPRSALRDSAWIGKASAGSDGRLRGRLCDLRIFERSRTQAEIQSSMQVPSIGNELGLIRHYPLDDMDPSQARDGTQRDGTLVGPASWEELPHRYSRSFDGKDSWLALPDIAGDFTQGFTVEAWVMFCGRDTSTAIIDLGRGQGLDNILVCTELTNPDLRLYSFTSSAWSFIEAKGVIQDNVWMHIAATMDSIMADGTGFATLYVNGEPKAQGRLPAPKSAVRSASFLGKCNWGNYQTLRGRMSEVRIWTRCRTQAELRTMMSHPLPSNPPGLYRYLPLDEIGATSRDRCTGTSYALTNLPGNGLLFNGKTDYVQLAGILSSDLASFTLEAKVFFSGNESWARIFDLGNGAAQDNVILARSSTSSTLALVVYVGSTPYTLNATNAITNGRWMHVAATYASGVGACIYVDGELKASGPLATPRSVERNQCFLGKSNWSADGFFRGGMTEVRIFNFARTQAQIQATQNTTLGDGVPGLRYYYKLADRPGYREDNAAWPLDGWRGWRAATIYGTHADARSLLPDSDCLRFDGRSSQVDLPGQDVDLSQGLTLEAWVYFSGSPRDNEVLIALGGGSVGTSLLLWRDHAADRFVISVGRAPTLDSLRFALPRKADSWLHLAITIDASRNVVVWQHGDFLANGTLSSTDTRSISTEFRSRLGMGLDSNNPFQGRMTEVRLWKQVRLNTQIFTTRSQRALGSEAGLVLHYPLNDGWGTVVGDKNRPQPGTILGDPQRFPRRLLGAQPTLPSAGSLEFNGTSTYVALPSIRADFSQGCTLEAWVYFDGVQSGSRIIELGRGEYADNITLARHDSTGALVLQVLRGDQAQTLTTPSVIADRAWMHVAATLNSQGNPKIYVNGVLQPVASTTAVGGSTLDFVPTPGVIRTKCYLGKSSRDLPLFKGRLADVRLWRRERSAAEIAGSQYNSLVVDDPALVANYRLDEPDGTQARDASSARLDADVRGMKRLWGAPAPYFLPDANQPGALSFSGRGDWVELPTISADLTQSFTLEAWVNFGDSAAYARVIELANGWNTDSIVVARDGSSSGLSITIGFGTGSSYVVAPNVIQNDTWMHVAVTLSSVVAGTGQATIYINGQVRATNSIVAPTNVSRRLCYLGKSTASWDPLFKGRMAEVRVWRVARTAAEINRYKDARLSGSENGLVAYYRLNESDGERAGDASRNRLHAWLRGTANWNQAAPLPTLRIDSGALGSLRFGGSQWVALPPLVPPVSQTVPSGFTLEAWVQPSDVSKSGDFIAIGDGTADVLRLGHQQSALVFGIQIGTQPEQLVSVGSVFNSGQWVHVAATVDENGHLWLCKNGVVVAGDKNSVSPPRWLTRGQVQLGRSSSGTLFQGSLSEVRIWTTPRTPRHVLENQQIRLGGSSTEPGLWACYPLQATRGLSVIDTGAQRRDGSVQGASAPAWDGDLPALTGVRPPALGAVKSGLLSFDGVSTYLRLPAISNDLSSGFTFEASLNNPGTAPQGAILDVGNGAAGDNIQIIARSDGRLAMRIYVGTTTYTDIVSKDVCLAPDNWCQLAFTVDSQRRVRLQLAGTSWPLTIDGVEGSVLPSGRMPRAGVTRSLCYLGKTSAAQQATLRGRLLEVRLWGRPRTAADVGTNWSLRLFGTEPGLIALYRLNESEGRVARSAAPGLGDATVCGTASWGVPVADSIVTYTPAPAPTVTIPTSVVAPVGPLPVVGQQDPASLTSVTWNPSVGIDVSDLAVNAALTTYATVGMNFTLLGVNAKVTFAGSVGWRPLTDQIVISGTPKLAIGSAAEVSLPTSTLALTKGATPMVYTLSFAPAASPSIVDLVRSAATDPLLASTFDAVLLPFLQLVTSGTVLVSSSDGINPTLGPYVKGMNLFVSRKLHELPVLNLVHAALPQLGLDSRSVVLSVGLSSTTEYQISASAVLDIKLIDTGPVSLVFNSLGIRLSSGATNAVIGANHAFTLTLLGETLLFRGGIKVEQTGAASAVTIWGALDPSATRGTTWKDPWGLKGIEIGGFGVQVRGGTAVGIGCRGEIHIGGGLIGGSVGLNIDTANPILFIDSPEGLDLPRLLTAFLSALPTAAKDAIAAMNTALAIRLKDLKLYLAPNGGEIAGQKFEKGISLGASLDLWGYRAKIFGRLDERSGAVLKGQADRIKIDVGSVTLLQFSDASGQDGPNVDVELTTSRQRIFYSGQLRLLNGVYQAYEELAVGSDGITFKGVSPLGALALALNWQAGTFALTIAPRFVYGFEVLGIPVNIDVGGEIAQRVDSAGFQQSLRFGFRVCGVGFDVGPVTWGVPLIDIKAIAEVFDSFFGDQVKSFFEDTLAGGLKQAYEWVRDNLTNIAEEAVAIFKTAGAAVADIAKNVYATFDTTAQEVIGFLGGTINEAAEILRDALNLVAEEAAEVLGAAYGVGADAVKAALGVAGYTASEIANVATTVWDGINTFVGYLDPTSW